MNSWLNPLPLTLVPTRDAQSFALMPALHTGLPLHPHPGSFAFARRNHTHEGVDLYAPPGTPVHAVEAGRVVVIEDFTGPAAGSPWWLDTKAVFVEGVSGVVVYGEIELVPGLIVGAEINAGQKLGSVVPVLRHDKGRPNAMLHLELHVAGARTAPAWEHERPASLLDPTPHLLSCVHQEGLSGK